MRALIVTYDLKRPGQNYVDLFKALQSFSAYAHYQQSAWIVVSDRTSVEVRDYLMRFIDKNDKLFVTVSTGEAAWYGATDEETKALKAVFGLASVATR